MQWLVLVVPRVAALRLLVVAVPLHRALNLLLNTLDACRWGRQVVSSMCLLQLSLVLRSVVRCLALVRRLLQSVALALVRRVCRVVVAAHRKLVVLLSIRQACHVLMVICVGA